MTNITNWPSQQPSCLSYARSDSTLAAVPRRRGLCRLHCHSYVQTHRRAGMTTYLHTLPRPPAALLYIHRTTLPHVSGAPPLPDVLRSSSDISSPPGPPDRWAEWMAGVHGLPHAIGTHFYSAAQLCACIACRLPSPLCCPQHPTALCRPPSCP